MGTNIIKQISVTLAGLTLTFLSISAEAFVGGQLAQAAQDPNMRMEATAGCVDGMCGQGGSADRLRDSARELLNNVNYFAEDGKDPMRYQSRTGAFAPIGRLDFEMGPRDRGNATGRTANGSGTAFLISPCYIYSARHNALPTAGPQRADLRKITFSVGQGRGSEFKHKKIRATPVLWSKLEDENGRDKPNAGVDPALEMVVLKLEQCVGEDPSIGWASLNPTARIDGLTSGLKIAGFPVGRDFERLSVEENCSVMQGQTPGSNGGSGGFNHSCGGQAGMSGAPIFYVNDGVPTVIGAHVSERRAGSERGVLTRRQYSDDYANVANGLDDQLDAISEMTFADAERFGRPNPLDQSPRAQRIRQTLKLQNRKQ